MEIQDEGSQLIAELTAPPPGGTVIDACAGAGGKTLALGALMTRALGMPAVERDDWRTLISRLLDAVTEDPAGETASSPSREEQ